jgi:cytidylate kinase
MPIITVTRQYGSGGSDVAARVAAILGWTLLDTTIVDAVALKMGVPTDIIRALDERTPPFVARLADTLALGTPQVMSPAAAAAVVSPDERVIEMTKRVMEDAVTRGPVVVVGRGAQVVLSQHTDAVHVFCYAPRDALIRRIATREGVPSLEAERMVSEVNRQRESAVRRHYGRAWSAPEHYHLCVNTEWLGIEGAAQLVAHTARDKFGLASSD